MKRTDILIILASLLIFTSVDLKAQEITVVPEGYVLVDSVIYRPVATVDTTLVGKDVFLLMPSREMGDNVDVKIVQTEAVKDAMRRQVADNASRTLSGYRVRIFFDNKQTARVESEETLKKFESMYHDVVAYRTYANPYFKVTVGDFRTRSEAVRLLERIKGEFPSAFVVKENIAFPVVDKDNAYVTDTIKVLRPKVGNI
jgi:hypothetical protein